MEEIDPLAMTRVKIEKPVKQEGLGFFFGLLLLLSFIFILFTILLLVMEWTGIPLPTYLRIPVGF